MRDGSKHNWGMWAAVAVSLLLLAIAGLAASAGDEPALATVQVSDSVSLELVAVLTHQNRRVDLSPWSRRMFWKLPRALRSTIYAFGRPAPSQMVRLFSSGPADAKFVFVGESTDGPLSQDRLARSLASRNLDHLQVSAGEWASDVLYLREEPVKGAKVIRTAQFDDVPTTAARLRLEFVGRPVMEKREARDPADGSVKVVEHVEIPNPHYRGR